MSVFFCPHPVVSGVFTLGTKIWMNNVAASVTAENLKLMKVPPKLHTRRVEELFYNFSKFYFYGSLASYSLVIAALGLAGGVAILAELR